MEIIDDALVASPQKAPHHVGSHAAKSDHAQFHVAFLSLESGSVRSTQMSDASAELRDFQSLLFACSAFLRVADEASSRKSPINSKALAITLFKMRNLQQYCPQLTEPPGALSGMISLSTLYQRDASVGI
jgi:hypothetical protein